MQRHAQVEDHAARGQVEPRQQVVEPTDWPYAGTVEIFTIDALLVGGDYDQAVHTTGCECIAHSKQIAFGRAKLGISEAQRAAKIRHRGRAIAVVSIKQPSVSSDHDASIG